MEMMKNYIFLTHEGCTYQPASESNEPNIDNMQVIGISEGVSSEIAFEILISENEHLLKTTFDTIFCYELNPNFKDCVNYFSLASKR